MLSGGVPGFVPDHLDTFAPECLGQGVRLHLHLAVDLRIDVCELTCACSLASIAKRLRRHVALEQFAISGESGSGIMMARGIARHAGLERRILRLDIEFEAFCLLCHSGNDVFRDVHGSSFFSSI